MKRNSKRRRESIGKVYRWATNIHADLDRRKKKAEKALHGLTSRKEAG
jgi:hypothetical protein